MEYYRLILYLIFGVLPSLIWLFYYLRQDLHPEPKRMIIKIFLYGILITIPVFLLQVSLSGLLNQLKLSGLIDGLPIVMDILKWFVVIAFTEELFKYLVVKFAILKSPVLDEPLDIMLYMIVAALGFAALENILYLSSPIDNISFDTIVKTTVAVSLFRFIGATFLHTLCSALLGYFLALSLFKAGERLKLTIIGISMATVLHGLYNFSIITLDSPFNFLIPIIIVMGLAAFIMYAFDKIKKMKGICKI